MSYTGEEELKLAAEPLGGLWDIKSLDPTIAGMLEHFSQAGFLFADGVRGKVNPRFVDRRLSIGYVNSSTINAWATAGASSDIILISKGIVEKLYGTMTGMCCLPDFMPSEWDQSETIQPAPPLRTGFPSFPLDLDWKSTEQVNVCFPFDIKRGALAQQLLTIAMHFLILHEVGHVYAGHLEIAAAGNVGASLTELGARGKGWPGPIPRYIIELEADAFAAHVCSFTDLHPEAERFWAGDFGLSSISGADAAFVAHASAISILFRVLDETEEPVFAPGTSSYPHPAVRSNLAIGRAARWAVNAGRLPQTGIPPLFERSLMVVERLWSFLEIPGRHFDIRSPIALQIAKLSDVLQEEYEKWETTLNGYARISPRWNHGWSYKHAASD